MKKILSYIILISFAALILFALYFTATQDGGAFVAFFISSCIITWLLCFAITHYDD